MLTQICHSSSTSSRGASCNLPLQSYSNSQLIATLSRPRIPLTTQRQSVRKVELFSSGTRNLCACSAQVTKVDAVDLQKEMANRTTPLVIDFYATWCGPCLLLAKELEKVAEQLGDKVKILKVDTDENPELSNQLRIEGLPTIVFVSTDFSKPAMRTEGLLPAETIITIINEELPKL